MLVFIAAFAIQWAIGAVINLFEITAANTYDPSGYKAAFAGLLACQAACLAWFWLWRPAVPRSDQDISPPAKAGRP